MKETLRGIVLGTVRHSDKSNITTIYTSERGRISFVVPLSSGRNQRARNALLMPLSIVEITANIRENRDLQILSRVNPIVIYRNIYFNPIKNAIGIFIADFLNRVLRDTMPDSMMWNYIADSLQYFDLCRSGATNFHIAFLCNICTFLGIQPDTYCPHDDYIFDMQAGRYVADRPLHNKYLTGEEALMPVLLLRMTYSNSRIFKFSGSERARILDGILQYYELHIPSVAGIKSVDILHSVFND